ncbi:winged helix-turn-helix domain-containing protein [Ilumatobacter sp.]|uniref:winged helix-turn-helix domain-containing protein n=1 Tax=Ilumatobacter sp. TaxID=1967498 RepID=UPI003C67A69B
MIVGFDLFEVDTGAFELRRDGRAVALEPQVFEVLAHLVLNAGRLVPKEELLDEIWGDRFVSESALTSRIKTARKAVGTALAEDRLVSLLGIGGAGKTRLAVAAARAVEGRFGDGVCFIDLVPIENGEEIDAALAAAAGLAIGPGSARQQIVSVLSERDVLIVFDNVEHLVDDVAALLDALLDGTTAPRFLVTSRVPVELVDERRFLVEALPVVGSAAGSAVDLFVRSAGRFGVSLQPADFEQAADVFSMAFPSRSSWRQHSCAGSISPRRSRRHLAEPDRRRTRTAHRGQRLSRLVRPRGPGWCARTHRWNQRSIGTRSDTAASARLLVDRGSRSVVPGGDG